MEEQHVLVDYENVQPSLEQIAKLAPGFTDAWLFHGPHQVNLPPPDVIAQEIVEDLQAALEQFKLIAGDLGAEVEEAP